MNEKPTNRDLRSIKKVGCISVKAVFGLRPAYREPNLASVFGSSKLFRFQNNTIAKTTASRLKTRMIMIEPVLLSFC